MHGSKRILLAFFFTLVSFATVPSATLAATANKSMTKINEKLTSQVQYRECQHGLHRQPNGPFAILVFCEDGMGTFIGVTCYEPGECEMRSLKVNEKKSDFPEGVRFQKWELSNRFWQEKIWATDVTSYAWSPDGKSLYVATSPIYGSGCLYKLDLERRITTQLLLKEKIFSKEGEKLLNPGYKIIGFDKSGKNLYYQKNEADESKIVTVALPIN